MADWGACARCGRQISGGARPVIPDVGDPDTPHAAPDVDDLAVRTASYTKGRVEEWDNVERVEASDDEILGLLAGFAIGNLATPGNKHIFLVGDFSGPDIHAVSEALEMAGIAVVLDATGIVERDPVTVDVCDDETGEVLFPNAEIWTVVGEMRGAVRGSPGVGLDVCITIDEYVMLYHVRTYDALQDAR